jgi:hypothetical protein
VNQRHLFLIGLIGILTLGFLCNASAQADWSPPPENIPDEPNILDRAYSGGYLSVWGLAGLAISAILFLVWLGLVVVRRRPFLLLGAGALGLALVSYVLLDWLYVSLILAMRDPQAVGESCRQLLLQKRERQPEEEAVYLTDAEVPAPIARLGAEGVGVHPDHVVIALYVGKISGAAWGFVYDPKRTYEHRGWPDDFRATWYRDFHTFRHRGH